MDAKFVLSKSVLVQQVKVLEDLGLKISYSYKTNRDVGRILQELPECKDVDFSIHTKMEIDDILDKSKIWFFCQAESEDDLGEILNEGVRNFVVDNETDLKRILSVVKKENIKINLSLRMKFQEHRIGTGKYFVYGMSAGKVSEFILQMKDNEFIDKLGVHIHRKSQNTSEWDIVGDLKDSLSEEILNELSIVNLGGGLPAVYISSSLKVYNYIFSKLEEARDWLAEKNIFCVIEPGRFIAAPAVKLVVEVVQKYDNNLVVNTTIYNCALDSVLINTKMLVEGELGKDDEGEDYLIKGNSPTRDDIFRYRVRLSKNVDIGTKIVFLNAGAYCYATDFFGYKKLPLEIID